ncbi:catalase-like [Ostrinia furnacalis]|uniref:catalase-like n=1 Tax=Ostrinia furnacalis TaxID=93504 RepID=UPI00103FC9AF|nr:catalase-like [Ostrinia furnacalis]
MLRTSVLVVVAVIANAQYDPAQQIIMFKQNTKGPIGIMTTSFGAPVEYTDARITLNRNLIHNKYFMDTLTHLVRERIPERVVHAKGAGAFGYFEVTNDITDVCNAKLFSTVGKKTPVATRFSLVVAERGGVDTSRDVRGFAIKFYTEDGNFDIVGLDTPVFANKDPVLFTSFARAQKRNPATNLQDGNMLWDYITLNPETLHIFMSVFSDRGIPDGFRRMPGFGIHTYEVLNKHNVKHFIRFHFTPDAGIKNLFTEDARKIAAEDPDYATRDLYRAIGNGEYPSWTMGIQVLTLNDVKKAGFDVFDVTKVLPLDKYPLRPVGKLVLNKNPINYFAEIEQLAFCPGNLVPGILGAPDKVFEARSFSYRDAQYYRLGANFNKIHVNCPIQSAVYAYNRDGDPPTKENGRDSPNYYPNSFNGAVPYASKWRVDLVDIYQDAPNNFAQITEMYVNELSKEERSRLVQNILYSLGPVAGFLQERAVKLFTIIHPDLGMRIEQGLAFNKTVG